MLGGFEGGKWPKVVPNGKRKTALVGYWRANCRKLQGSASKLPRGIKGVGRDRIFQLEQQSTKT